MDFQQNADLSFGILYKYETLQLAFVQKFANNLCETIYCLMKMVSLAVAIFVFLRRHVKTFVKLNRYAISISLR